MVKPFQFCKEKAGERFLLLLLSQVRTGRAGYAGAPIVELLISGYSVQFSFFGTGCKEIWMGVWI